MHRAHDPLLVALSILIACVAGYVALELVGRVAAARGSPRIRAGWLAGVALAMGIGIWDMHFVGMLAFGLHADGGTVPIAYDVPLVLLSVAVSVVASALALAAAGRERLAPAALAAAALLMGAAIAGMHYIGMAAMRVPVRVSYVPSLVAASILVAVVASGVALGLAFRLRGDETGHGRRHRAAAAALIGVAIAGMHYTAMAAARFAPLAADPVFMDVPTGSVLATTGLAWWVGGATLAILTLALLGAALDRHLRARAARARELRRLYVAAEEARLEAGRAHELLQGHAGELEQQVEKARALAEELERTNEELRVALRVAERATVLSEEAAARTSRLQALTAALSATLTPAEVARVVVEHGLAALRAGAGSVATVDAATGELELIGAFGYESGNDARALDRLGRVPLDADLPLAEAARSGVPVLLTTAGERAARYPLLAALLPADGTGAMAAVPLAVDGRLVGALGIDFLAGVVPSEEDRHLLLSFAQQCALALDRARLFEAEATSRREAQEASRRLAFLADAGAALTAGMTDYEATLALTARLAVPAIADYCVVDLMDAEGLVRRLAEAHTDPALETLLRGTRRYYPEAATSGVHPLRAAIEANEPRLVAEVTDAWIRSAARGEEHLADVRALAPRSVMMVPLRTYSTASDGTVGGMLPDGPAGGRARGEAYGLITFVATAASGRRFTPGDLALAMELGDRAAVVVDNARLFRDAEAARLAAERANQAKSEFLAVMSHELRTPINAVIGYAELLALGIDGPVSDAQRGRLERIRASSAHLSVMVDEILDLAKIESGELALHLESAEAGAAADAALALTLPQAVARGLHVDAACGGERHARYIGDVQRVRQIIANLLSNAVKFTEPGGRVRISCATVAEPPREAALPPSRPDGSAPGDGRPDPGRPDPGLWTCLVVEDTGIGIAPDRLASVFDPFVQIDTGLTRTRGGTGLGLAISRRLARAMGGDLTVESEPGVGSRFALWLPADESAAVRGV